MIALIESGLVARLKSDAAVSALVGSRIRPLTLQQGETLPALVYQKISDVPDYAMGGQTGLAAARIQIASWTDGQMNDGSSGYSQAKRLAEAVRLCLSGWRGTVAVGADSVEVDWVELDNQTDLYDPEAGRGLPMYAVISDYMVAYRQGIPRWQ